jgi:uncharacterized protein YabN with tetrapyrrole methylase and pyrophosphatase domain
MSSLPEYKNFNRLQAIIATLRSERGCPWDRKQTPETIKKYLLEESRELAEAIETGDHLHIREELGDLFYILFMLTKMHEEKQLFTADDVLNDICEKMIRRHPHVYSGVKAGNDEELRLQWEAIKAWENRNKNSMNRTGCATVPCHSHKTSPN